MLVGVLNPLSQAVFKVMRCHPYSLRERANRSQHHSDLEDLAPAPGALLYDDDGVVRSSYLAHIGAAIADRDTLTLQREVAEIS